MELPNINLDLLFIQINLINLIEKEGEEFW